MANSLQPVISSRVQFKTGINATKARHAAILRDFQQKEIDRQAGNLMIRTDAEFHMVARLVGQTDEHKFKIELGKLCQSTAWGLR